MPLRSPFDAGWPRYAVASHVLFWSTAAAFLLSCVGGYAGLIGGQIVISLFWFWIASGFLLGLAASFSGKLYIGNQVFRRSPLTGWVARTAGIVVSALAAFIMLFAYGLMHVRFG